MSAGRGFNSEPVNYDFVRRFQSEPTTRSCDGRPDGEQVTAEIREVVSAQRRRRRLMFWLGFFAILLVGALWAGLTKDPLGPNFFGDEFGLAS